MTYVSTSWRKEVATTFINSDQGMMLQIDPSYKEKVKCCDVSWISKFPDECEVLFARSIGFVGDNFKCEVIDESSGVQTVVLKSLSLI